MHRTLAISIVLALSTFASPAFADVGDNSVGMNVHGGRQPFVDACADLGVEWIRVDANWWVLEPNDDQYDWTYLDNAVNAANAAGIKVFMTLAYTPSWVPRSGDTDGDPINDIPDVNAWTDFVADAVAHFRPMGVTHYGLWNEPNLDHFFEGDANTYVDVIAIPGAAAVRGACNDCFVLGPDLANVGSDADDWLEDILSRAGLQTFDIVTHHSYNGFPELGTEIYDGDRYFNVLDEQRFPFTRRSLRQVLDSVGWTGELWMTETGYRTEPVDSSSEEDRQATYYELVLDEQLERGWYTNTFFYEIHDCGPDQPTCDIDGFGIMRATAGTPGNRTYPADFRTKPAFDALRDKIANTPALTGGPPPECGNGEDDDGDGRIDLDDRGCSDGADDNEFNDPPREQLFAYHVDRVSIDGDLGDWSDDGWIALDQEYWRGTEPLDVIDLQVRAAARWSTAGLYLAFDVSDEAHVNAHPPEDLWLGDSVQVAFDLLGDSDVGYDDVDDHELGFALTDDGIAGHRFHGLVGADGWTVAIARDQLRTRYEIFLPPEVLPRLMLEADATHPFSFLVNDDDGTGRAGWIEWTPGIGTSKEPYWFGELALLEAGDQPPPDMGDGGADMGGPTDQDAGVTSSRDGGTSQEGGDAGSASGGDAGLRDDVDEPAGEGGCQCTAAHAHPSAPFWLFVLACALLRRRRRSEPGRSRSVAPVV